MWHQGMLKGHDERDMVATLEYQGKGGTIQVDGQPCTLTKYPREHQLPDLQPADSVRLHARERTGLLEHRGGQRAVRLERRHAGRGDRRDEGQGHADAGGRAGAAHPHLGQSAGRAEGRARRDDGHLGWAPTRARCSPTVSTRWATRPCRGKAGKPVVTFPIPGVAGRDRRRPRSMRST